jgi:hypothetical protein
MHAPQRPDFAYGGSVLTAAELAWYGIQRVRQSTDASIDRCSVPPFLGRKRGSIGCSNLRDCLAVTRQVSIHVWEFVPWL